MYKTKYLCSMFRFLFCILPETCRFNLDKYRNHVPKWYWRFGNENLTKRGKLSWSFSAPSKLRHIILISSKPERKVYAINVFLVIYFSCRISPWYYRVIISSDDVFSKILKKPFIVEKWMIPHMRGLIVFIEKQQKFFFFLKNWNSNWETQ